MHKHKNTKFNVVGEQPATNCIQFSRTDLRVTKLHRLKSQLIFSGASQTKWGEPFDFPPGISGFPMLMVSSPESYIVALPV